jgi:hypothetical protein
MEEAAATEDREETTVLEEGVARAVAKANLVETTHAFDNIAPLKRKADGQHEVPHGTTTKKQKRHDRGTRCSHEVDLVQLLTIVQLLRKSTATKTQLSFSSVHCCFRTSFTE